MAGATNGVYEKLIQKNTLMCCFVFGLVVIGGRFVNASEIEWLRHNGTGWISFGPAIIGKCKRIDLHFHEEGDYTSSEGKGDLGKVKAWVSATFQERLNQSPVAPSFKAVYHPIYVDVFASEEGKTDDLSLKIPLTPQMIGTDEDTFHRKMVELKMLMLKSKP